MKIENRVQILEEELKIMKNEIKTVLLDLSEQCKSRENQSTTTNYRDDKT